MFHAWQQQAQKLRDEELSDEGYNQWCYNYPQGEQDKFRNVLIALSGKIVIILLSNGGKKPRKP